MPPELGGAPEGDAPDAPLGAPPLPVEPPPAAPPLEPPPLCAKASVADNASTEIVAAMSFMAASVSLRRSIHLGTFGSGMPATPPGRSARAPRPARLRAPC